MENLIKALEEANKKIKEVIDLQEEIKRDLLKLNGQEELDWDNRDNKNEDSNFEKEQ